MFEKVNPSHPDKIADRIAGAVVDLAYGKQANPKCAVEVLIGHGKCHIIIESSVDFDIDEIGDAVRRISEDKDIVVNTHLVPQDKHLAENQSDRIRCGDNGIFRGTPITFEQMRLSNVVHKLYKKFPTDGKYIISGGDIIACQSNAESKGLERILRNDYGFDSPVVNPLGDWTGGTDVDTGATNRKLGSDMGDAVTGGGLHGKDLSKADVSVNIYAHLRAQQTGKPVELHCAIGDEHVDGLPYSAIVEVARDYVFNCCGGFEKFAEWGLI